MTAAVLATPSDAPPQDSPWGAMRLCGLLEAAARRHQGRPAFRDQPGREAWCGRPRLEWSYALAVKIVGRLAAAFSALRLEPGSPIGICLPGSSEAALTILAVEKAGHRPCLLPAAWREVELERALLAARVAAVVSFGRLAEDSPAEILCRIAARSFGLRFLFAYGPGVPDGVIDLDRVLVDDGGAPVEPGITAAPDDPGLITFGRRGGQASPLHRTASSLVASAVTFLVAARIAPGDRILSLLAADDHCGLATGLAAALLFRAAGLGQALAHDVPTHLVAPGWLEPAIAAADLSSRLASTVLVHAAPIRFRAKMPLKDNVVDVIAFDELALMARARDATGRLTLALGDDGGAGAFLRVRRDEDGAISFSGPAAEVRGYARAGMEDAGSGTGWRNSGFKADVFAGIVIGNRDGAMQQNRPAGVALSLNNKAHRGLMTEFQKVLVVDDGARNAGHAISAELAGLGFASVTTSFEATDEVLELIPPPAAILLQLPRRSRTADYKDFMDLADRLKAKNSAIPVILIEQAFGVPSGSYAAVLQSELGARALNKPEL